jgi:hypothetical protein
VEFVHIKRRKNRNFRCFRRFNQRKNGGFRRSSTSDEFGSQKLFKTDISLSTTGVAGPNSDEFESEIGTVFYSVRIKNFEKTFKLYLPHLERKDFMNFVSMKVLQDLIEILVKENL